MFTFLPAGYKERIVGEYRARLVAVCLFLGALVALVGFASMLPLSVVLSSKRSALEIDEKSGGMAAYASGKAEIEAEIGAIKEMIGILERDAAKKPILSVVEQALAEKGADISFSRIVLDRSREQGNVTVAGTAPSRDALVAFSRRLSSVPSFSNVNLPLGSLAKSRDIPFSITLDSKF